MRRPTPVSESGAALVVTLAALLGAVMLMVGLVRVGGADIDRQHAQRSADLAALAAVRLTTPPTDAGSVAGLTAARLTGTAAIRRAAVAAAAADGSVLRMIVVNADDPSRVRVSVAISRALSTPQAAGAR